MRPERSQPRESTRAGAVPNPKLRPSAELSLTRRFVASSLRLANAEELGDPAKELRRVSLKYPAVPSLHDMRG